MTKRNVAKTRARTKPRTEKPEIQSRRTVGRVEKPVDSEIRRAAKRAGIRHVEKLKAALEEELLKGAAPEASSSRLTPEDEALISWRESAGVGSRAARPLFEQLRALGYDNERLAAELRGEAHNLDKLQERLTRSPETESRMLRDALKVIEAAELIFYVNDIQVKQSPMELLEEAIASAAQEHAVMSVCREGSSDPVEWQEHWRAEHRLQLAQKIAAFRTKHGYYKPTTEAEQTEGGAS